MRVQTLKNINRKQVIMRYNIVGNRTFIIGILLLMIGSLQAELLPYPLDTINGQIFYRYEVEKSIGLYRISKNFGVSQDEILRWNPNLNETGLRYGETVLLIPVKDAVIPEQKEEKRLEEKKEEAVAPIIESKSAAPVEVILPTMVAETPAADTVQTDTLAVATGKTRHIALLLPLQAKAMQRDQQMDRFFDFYQGVLLATYELQSQEHPYALHVFDIGKSQSEVKKLIDNNQLRDMDAVIGPAYPAQVLMVSDWCIRDSVPVLIPFIDKVIDIERNPMLLQFNSSEQTEVEAMMAYLHGIEDSVNCVLVEAAKEDIPGGIRVLRDSIMQSGIPYTTTTLRQILNDSLSLSLREGKENILLFNTQKYTNVHFLMPRIRTAAERYKVTLLSQYSWQDENIGIPQLFTSDFYVEDEVAEQRYEQLFTRFFHNTHAGDLPRYDILGYDLMHELMAWMDGEEYRGVQSEVKFVHVAENGGWKNTNVYIIRK